MHIIAHLSVDLLQPISRVIDPILRPAFFKDAFGSYSFVCSLIGIQWKKKIVRIKEKKIIIIPYAKGNPIKDTRKRETVHINKKPTTTAAATVTKGKKRLKIWYFVVVFCNVREKCTTELNSSGSGNTTAQAGRQAGRQTKGCVVWFCLLSIKIWLRTAATITPLIHSALLSFFFSFSLAQFFWNRPSVLFVYVPTCRITKEISSWVWHRSVLFFIFAVYVRFFLALSLSLHSHHWVSEFRFLSPSFALTLSFVRRYSLFSVLEGNVFLFHFRTWYLRNMFDGKRASNIFVNIPNILSKNRASPRFAICFGIYCWCCCFGCFFVCCTVIVSLCAKRNETTE